MKFLAAVISLALLPLAATAQKIPLGCQYLVSAGVAWQNGAWHLVEFEKFRPFTLVVQNSRLAVESVRTAINVNALLTCTKDVLFPYETCVDTLGVLLFFNHETLQGGVAYLGGTGRAKGDRDGVIVSPFVCQRY